LASYSALRDYIHYFTACAIGTSISKVPSISEDSGLENENFVEQAGQWHQTPQPTTLRTTIPPSNRSKLPKTKQLCISIQRLTSPTKSGLRLRALWEWSGKEQEGSAIGGRKSSFGFPVLMEAVHEKKNKETVRFKGEGVYDWVAWDGEEGKVWDDGEGEVVRTLESVVADACK
jgi:mediator of RNA polymerase II transcription subunit 17